MAELTFNTAPNTTVERKMLVLYLNTGTTEAPVWSPVGRRVEDSSMAYNWNESSKNDIFGVTWNSVKRPVITQTFEPCELDAGDVAQVKIWNQAIKDQNVSAMVNNDMLVVHTYAGDADTGVFAERYPACMVKPSGLGGSATVGMPIDVTYGGERQTGTATVAAGKVTFTGAA